MYATIKITCDLGERERERGMGKEIASGRRKFKVPCENKVHAIKIIKKRLAMR